MSKKIAEIPDTSDVVANTVLWQYDRSPNIQQLTWHKGRKKNDDGSDSDSLQSSDYVQDGFLELLLASSISLGDDFYTYIFNAPNTAEDVTIEDDADKKSKLEFGLGVWSALVGVERPYKTLSSGALESLSLRAWGRYIRGEMFKMYSNGSCDAINKFLKITVPDANVFVIDYQDMTIGYASMSVPEGDDADLIALSGFFPSPAGVCSADEGARRDGILGFNGSTVSPEGSNLLYIISGSAYYYQVSRTVGETTVPRNLIPDGPFYYATTVGSTPTYGLAVYDETTDSYKQPVETTYSSLTFYAPDGYGNFHQLTCDSESGKYYFTLSGERIYVPKADKTFYKANGTTPETYTALRYESSPERFYYITYTNISTLYVKDSSENYTVVTRVDAPYRMFAYGGENFYYPYVEDETSAQNLQNFNHGRFGVNE